MRQWQVVLHGDRHPLVRRRADQASRQYVGQPLSIKVVAAGLSGTAVGADYVATFSAQVVKKK
jgi:hypothetical protein